MTNTAAIILAAGKGTRMNFTHTNKVMLKIVDKPMLSYTVENLEKAGMKTIVVVIGFANEEIINYFGGRVMYAKQTEQLGTAHAFSCGLAKLSSSIKTIVSVSGDDSYLYSADLYKKAVAEHMSKKADMTILTVTVADPTGLGRIVRNSNGTIRSIVEEKEATTQQKKIREINTGFYVFNRPFIEQNISLIKNNNNAHEYYLTDILDIAVKKNAEVASIVEKNLPWRGVNRPDELQEANQLMTQLKS
jgi:bifunctional UDP-N-acetylglucosamine pyrophosphorylase/glucosamine-1-phosphate N-acetyltransferase